MKTGGAMATAAIFHSLPIFTPRARRCSLLDSTATAMARGAPCLAGAFSTNGSMAACWTMCGGSLCQRGGLFRGKKGVVPPHCHRRRDCGHDPVAEAKSTFGNGIHHLRQSLLALK